MLKVFLIGMMATLTAGFALVAYISLRPPPAAPVVADAPAPPPVTKVLILAMNRSVRPGELLKPEDVGTIEVASNALPEGAQPDTPAARAELAGAMVRRVLSALQPLAAADVLRPTDGGFLAAVLAPSHRAVSIAVDAVSGTAGLIWPGDRVDLILTQIMDETGIPVGRRTFGETVLQDVRVIAVDQQLARGVSPDAAINTQTQGNRTVTLEVMPDAAERVAVAVRLGKLALSVRAADVSQPAEAAVESVGASAPPNAGVVRTIAQMTPTPRTIAQVATQPNPAAAKAPATTWGQDVSPGLNRRTSEAAKGSATVRVFQGNASEKEFKFE